MSFDERRMPFALLGVTLVWCLALALLGADHGLPFLVPALLLAAPLAIRLYPGEETLLALVEPPPRRRRAPARARLPRRALGARIVVRGALLIATSLAKRPPPLAAVPS